MNLHDQHLIAISAGELHSVALTNDYQCFSWGYNHYGQLGVGNYETYAIPQRVDFFVDKGISSIVAGGFHTVVITNEGKCFVWGCNFDGLLGIENEQHAALPKEVIVGNQERLISITSGGQHFLAVCENGQCVSWGQNQQGQLGIGNYAVVPSPQVIPLPTNNS